MWILVCLLESLIELNHHLVEAYVNTEGHSLWQILKLCGQGETGKASTSHAKGAVTYLGPFKFI